MARDFRPEAVVGRLSEVKMSDWAKLGVDAGIELEEECAGRRRVEVAALGVVLFCGRRTAREREEAGVSL